MRNKCGCKIFNKRPGAFIFNEGCGPINFCIWWRYTNVDGFLFYLYLFGWRWTYSRRHA